MLEKPILIISNSGTTALQGSLVKRYMLLAFILALAFGVLSWLVFTDKAVEFDTEVEKWIASWYFKGLNTFFDLVADTVVIITFLLLIVILLCLLKLPRLALLVVLASAGSGVISTGLKNLFQRVRPGVELSDNIYSYPSGHATLAICLYGALIFVAQSSISIRWIKWLLSASLAVLIIAIGLSRVYFGHHYPTDVLAGWLIGSCYLLILIASYHFLAFRINFLPGRRKPPD